MPRFTLRDIPYSIRISGADGAVPIAIANAANLNPTASVCLSVWVYPVGTPKEFVLFDKTQSGATNSYFVSVGADGSPKWFSIIGGIGRNLSANGKSRRVIWNQWNLLEAGYDGSAIKMFLNGNELTETITGISGTMGVTTQDLRIGGYFTGATGLTLNGYIYRPILNTTLPTLAEHQNRYFNGIMSDAFIAGTLLDLRMTEGSGSTLADSSTFATNATIGSLGTITTWNSSYAPTKLRTAISTARTAVSTPRPAVGEAFVLNGDFTTVPTLVAPQTTTGYIDGTATGSAVPIVGSNWAVFGINNSITAQIDATETYNGKATLKLATTAVNSRVTAQNILSATRAGMLQAIPVLPSTAYTCTFYMKTNVTSGDSNDGAHAAFVERSSEGAQVVVNTDTPIKVTQDWTLHTISFTTNSATRFLTIRPHVTGNTGTATLIMDAWFADFHVYSTALLRTAVS